MFQKQIFVASTILALLVCGLHSANAGWFWKGPTSTTPEKPFYPHHKARARKNAVRKFLIEKKWDFRFRRYRGYSYSPFEDNTDADVESEE